MVMAGAYPGALDDRENEKLLKCLINKGIDTFVCLQEELDDETPEEEWRAGRALRPYFIDARRLSKKPLIWRHLPIVDGGAAADDVMEALVCDLIDDVKAGRVLYVHCWGGHGRAGLVATLILSVLYSLQPAEALKRVQAYHDCRIEPQGVKSPSTVSQRSQVKRLLQKWKTPAGEAAAEASDQPATTVQEDSTPQVVIGKNGARGFIVSKDRPCEPSRVQEEVTKGNWPAAKERTRDTTAMERAMSLPRIGKDDCIELLGKAHMKGPPSKHMLMNLQLKSSKQCSDMDNCSTLARREISLHKCNSAAARSFSTGRIAGTGAQAAVQLRRCS
jgi:hypothetical protein